MPKAVRTGVYALTARLFFILKAADEGGVALDANERARVMLRVSVRNIISNVLLAGVKIAAGSLAGSLAVMTDGLNSLSDVFTTLVVTLSSRYINAPRDLEHQYGHEKIESVVTLIISLFLGLVACFTIFESFMRFAHRRSVSLSIFALAVTLLSAGAKFLMCRTTLKAARAIESDALVVVAVDYRFDVVMSCTVFLGVLLAMLGLWFFEPLAALVASAFLLKSTVVFFVASANKLVDCAADQRTIGLIEQTALACEGVREVNLLKTRQHGSKLYVDIEISVDPTLTVYDGHVIAQRVHDDLEGAASFRIIHCMVHVNPYARASE